MGKNEMVGYGVEMAKRVSVDYFRPDMLFRVVGSPRITHGTGGAAAKKEEIMSEWFSVPWFKHDIRVALPEEQALYGHVINACHECVTKRLYVPVIPHAEKSAEDKSHPRPVCAVPFVFSVDEIATREVKISPVSVVYPKSIATDMENSLLWFGSRGSSEVMYRRSQSKDCEYEEAEVY